MQVTHFLNVLMVNLLFCCHITLYWEKFPKFQLKWNFRNILQAETGSRLKEIIQPPPHKIFLRFCNLGQNISRLFHVLALFLFTTSEMALDYYNKKVNARVALRFTEQQKLGNFKKIPKMLRYDCEHPADHPKGKFWHLCKDFTKNQL